MGSVVVIGLNEGEHLRRALLSALDAADMVDGFCEVLYSDAGSNDGSVALARSLGVQTIAPAAARLSAAQARNAGWRAARGEWVQFLDGDMQLDGQWVERARRELADGRLAAVGGWVRERRLRATVWNTAFGLDWARTPGDEARLGGAALWRRSALEALDGFDEALPVGEDPDLCLRALACGMRVRRLPVPMVEHDLDLRSLRDYWRRAKSVGRSRVLVARKHPDRRELRRNAWRPLVQLAAAVCCLALGLWWHPLALIVLCAAALAVVGRTALRARRGGASPAEALISGIHAHLVKIPISVGALGTELAG